MNPTDPVRFLSDQDLQSLGVAPAEVADAIEVAIADQAAGRLHSAPKSAVLPGDGRYMMTTLSVGDGPGLTVVKAVTVSPENGTLGLPAINGAILALDARTGLLKAVLSANWVTAERTAALSLVAARRLANPDARSVAFIGTGVQAQSHLRAFQAQFPLTEVRAFGRGQANLDALGASSKAMGLAFQQAETPQSALEGADLIVTSITLDYSVAPFLRADWVKPGAFAAITDLAIPWHPETMPRFRALVVDDLDQEKAAPKPLVATELISGDLSDLVMGRAKLGFDPKTPSAFVFRGIALGDFAATALVLSKLEDAPST